MDFAQSAGAVGYTNCTSVEGVTPPQTSVWWWGSSNTGALGKTESTLSLVVAPDRALSMG